MDIWPLVSDLRQLHLSPDEHATCHLMRMPPYKLITPEPQRQMDGRPIRDPVVCKTHPVLQVPASVN